MLALLVVLVTAPPLPDGAVAALGSPRFRVDGSLDRFCVSPDDSLIAVEGTHITLFEAATGSVLRHFKDMPSVDRALFLASGELCLVGFPGDDNDGTELRLYEPRTGVERRRVRFGKALPGAPDVSPDGLLLACDNESGEVIDLYSAVTGKKLDPVRFRKGDSIGSARFAPCGRFLVCTSPHGWLYAFDRVTGAGLMRHRVHNPQALHFSADGQYLAVSGGPNGDEIAVFDLPGVRHVRTVTSQPSANWVGFGPKNRLYVGTDLWTDVFDPAAGLKKLSPLPRPKLGVYDARVSRDGSTMTANTGHGTLVRWDAATGEERAESAEVFGGLDCGRVFFSRPGRVSAQVREQGWVAFDARTGRTTRVSLDPSDDPRSTLSPDERTLVVCTETAVELRGPKTGKVRKSFPHTEDEVIETVTFTADSKSFVGKLGDAMLRVWDIEAGTSSDLNPAGGRPVAAFAVAGDTIAVAVPETDDADDAAPFVVKRFRLDGSPLGKPVAVPVRPEVLLLSSDGRVLVTAGFGPIGRESCIVTGFDAEAGVRYFYSEFDPATRPVAVTPDGGGVLVIQGGSLVLLETRTGQERFRRAVLPFNDLLGAAVSPDGRYAATTGGAIPVLLWDLKAVPVPADVAPKSLWRDLAADAAVAYRAQCYLDRVPGLAERLLREHPLPPSPAPDRVRAWAADLDARDFATRKAAKAELGRHAEAVKPLLELLLKESNSAEKRAALSALLAARERPSPDRLRRLRLADVLAGRKPSGP